MQGTLDTFSVVEILQMLGRVRRSGTLHIECAERLIDVHFVHGRIAETRDSTRVATDTVLGSQLLKRSLIDERSSRKRSREQEHNPGPWARSSSRPGTSPRATCARCSRARSPARSWPPSWRPRAPSCSSSTHDPAPVDFITIDTHSVLLEISAVGGDYCLAVEVLGAAHTVLVRNRDYETLPGTRSTWARDEFLVLALVDGDAASPRSGASQASKRSP